MPLYEFVCGRCSKHFDEIVSTGAATPACPECARDDEVARVPFGRVAVGKKENLRPPDIKSRFKPPR
ncbi:MAG TPA: FmdB family zinc ribbon protein [Polyangiales bacterium]|nr:FmdB family zinc ribbon protein [Polyangiales bacterium]